jgi:magnesium and cobalt transporter
MSAERRRDTRTRSLVARLAEALRGGPADREALLAGLRAARARELFDADALAMLEGVLGTAETQVRDVMVPRSQMVVIEKDAPRAEVLQRVVESGHSRFPVVGDDKDQVAGIVLAKDLLRHFAAAGAEDEAAFAVREYLRPAIFIPESKRLNVLLKDFRANRNHMAIVVDEYGGVAGLVTIEDVLEQIVGDIGDEHDVDEGTAIVQLSDTRFEVRALAPLGEFNAAFGVELGDGHQDTVGGVVTAALGHIPRRGEKLTLGRIQFRVLRADNRRPHLFEVVVLPEAE